MFKPMDDWSMSKDYNGAECFSDGSRPLLAETPFADVVISGRVMSSEVLIGVYPYHDSDGFSFYEGVVETREVAEQIGLTILEWMDSSSHFSDANLQQFFTSLPFTNVRVG